MKKWFMVILLAGCLQGPSALDMEATPPAPETPAPTPEQPITIWQQQNATLPSYEYRCPQTSAEICVTTFPMQLEFPDFAYSSEGQLALTGTVRLASARLSDVQVWLQTDDWQQIIVPEMPPVDQGVERVGSNIVYDDENRLHLIYSSTNPTGATFSSGTTLPPRDAAYAMYDGEWSDPIFVSADGRIGYVFIYFDELIYVLVDHPVPPSSSLFVLEDAWLLRTTFDGCLPGGPLRSYGEQLQIGCALDFQSGKPSGTLLYPNGPSHLLAGAAMNFPIIFNVGEEVIVGMRDGLALWYLTDDNLTHFDIDGRIRAYEQFGPDLHVLLEDEGIRHVIIRNRTVIHNELQSIVVDETVLPRDLPWALQVTKDGLIGAAWIPGGTYLITIAAS